MTGAPFKYGDQKKPTPTETKLKELIDKFTQLQTDRYEADYNVGRIWSRTDALRTLGLADEVFALWNGIRKEKVVQHHLMSMFGAKH